MIKTLTREGERGERRGKGKVEKVGIWVGELPFQVHKPFNDLLIP